MGTPRKSINELLAEDHLKKIAQSIKAEVIRLARESLDQDRTLVAFKMSLGAEWFERANGTRAMVEEDSRLYRLILRWSDVAGMAYWSLVVKRKKKER